MYSSRLERQGLPLPVNVLCARFGWGGWRGRRETDRQTDTEGGGTEEIRGGVGCDMSTKSTCTHMFVVTREGLTSSQNDSYQLRLGFQFILTFGWLGQCGDLHQLGLGAVMGERE